MRIAIIGNGISGVTAALRLREKQPEWKIQIISGESTFHYSRPALMYIFMGHMRFADTKPFPDRFWSEKRLELIRDWVTGIDVKQRRLTLHRGSPIEYDQLLLATGSRPNRFGWPGQELRGVQGLWDLADLRQLYENSRDTRHAVIVGGGLIGIELAEMLHSRGVAVTFLVREESYWNNIIPEQESALINRLIEEKGIGLRLATQLKEIVDDGSGRCGAVVTDRGERIECQIVGLTAGVGPNLDLVRDTPLETARGIIVDRRLATSHPGIFAAGDCAEIRRNGTSLIQQVWYTGKRQGERVAEIMAGEKVEYDPGVWFNSAKFFDLEYQVYGRVNTDAPGEKNLYWEHRSGRHAARIVYTTDGVIGINVMGLRWKHELCERWIVERRPVAEVLDELRRVRFDPELGPNHEREIVRALEEQIR